MTFEQYPYRDPEDDFEDAAALNFPQVLLYGLFAVMLLAGALLAAAELYEHRNPPAQETR